MAAHGNNGASEREQIAAEIDDRPNRPLVGGQEIEMGLQPLERARVSAEKRVVGQAKADVAGFVDQPHGHEGIDIAGEADVPRNEIGLHAGCADILAEVGQRFGRIFVDQVLGLEAARLGIVAINVDRSHISGREVWSFARRLSHVEDMAEARLRRAVEGDIAERRVDEDVGSVADTLDGLGVGRRCMIGLAVGFAGMEMDNGSASGPARHRVGSDFSGRIGHIGIALIAHHEFVDAGLDDELFHDILPGMHNICL